MRDKSLQFLKDLIFAPSPSGYEQPAQEVVRRYAADFADDIRTDVHGNVMAIRNADAPVRVMLAGHCDQIGLMVQHIADSGMLHIAAIGGWDPKVLIGQRVLVHAAEGALPGVIGRKPIHLMPAEARASEKLEVEELWVDIGAKDQAAAEKLVAIGDCITVEPHFTALQQDLVAAPGLDDKVGVYVVMEALRLVPKGKLKCAVYAVSTVQEEVGLRGAHTSAYGINPHAGIAVDVTHATDYPGVDPKRTGKVELRKGPSVARGANINPPLRALIVQAAQERKIPYQNDPAPRGTGTDANAIQISRAGVAAGLVSIPNRYMHSPVEIVSLEDLDNAAKLLAQTLTYIDESTDFTPR
jgi:putative aminopeptidase FrvX